MMLSRKKPSLLLLAPALAASLLLATGCAVQAQSGAQPTPATQTAPSGWRYHVESIASGANDGFQLALDPVAGRVYVADAEWRTEKRDAQGTVWVQRTASGKLTVFDSADRSLLGVHSFLDLSRADGKGTERAPLDWSGVTDPKRDELASMRSTFSPYGVAVDGTTLGADGKPDATIITTAVRGRDAKAGHGGHVVIYRASQGAPRDADRLWQFADGTPFAEGMRRVVVNTRTHKAYITNMGQWGKEPNRRPGHITVIDLPTRKVEARVALPLGTAPIGVAVDEANNLVYVGALGKAPLHVFDAGKVDASNPQSLALNAALAKPLGTAEVEANARPEYDPVTRRLYVASFDDPKGSIAVVDADPRSAGYGKVLKSVKTGRVNAVTVDARRGLLLSANLGDKELVVHALNTLDVLLRVPTSGEPINAAVDPKTGNIWVANGGNAGKVDVITLKAPGK